MPHNHPIQADLFQVPEVILQGYRKWPRYSMRASPYLGWSKPRSKYPKSRACDSMVTISMLFAN